VLMKPLRVRPVLQAAFPGGVRLEQRCVRRDSHDLLFRLAKTGRDEDRS
jgi:hypothetical protein